MDVSELTTLIRKTPELLAKVQNVGLTGDWEDLYTVADFLAYAFGRAYPTLPCKAGCSHCCEQTMFRVTEAEWQALRRYLEAVLDPAATAEFRARVREVYGPQRDQLEELAAFWNGTELGAPGAPMEGLKTRCPFLSATGECGVYEVRPLVCRAYGSFGATIEGRPTMLICKPYGPGFINGLSEAAAESLTVAPIEPLYQRLSEIAPDSPVAPLPLWVMRWADG